MNLPTPQAVRNLLAYDAETGLFRWKLRAGKEPAGSTAGTINSCGYMIITINGRKLGAHRLAWVITHGVWPPHEVDHKNNQRADNRLSNLRPATGAQNRANRAAGKNNASGAKGVKALPNGRFQSRITVNYVEINLGCYSSVIEAAEVYKQAAQTYHGEFAHE